MRVRGGKIRPPSGAKMGVGFSAPLRSRVGRTPIGQDEKYKIRLPHAATLNPIGIKSRKYCSGDICNDTLYTSTIFNYILFYYIISV